MYKISERLDFESSPLYPIYRRERNWFLSLANEVYRDASLDGAIPHSHIDLDLVAENVALALVAPKKWTKIRSRLDPWMNDIQSMKYARDAARYMVYIPSESIEVFNLYP